MKGRPRDPTRARRRTGHRRKPDEAPKLAVMPAPEREALGLEPPPDLSEEGKLIWTQLLELMGPGSGVRPIDAFGLEALVRQYVRMRQMGAIVDQYGPIAKRASGDVVPTPFARAERDATAAFLRLAEQYGLTTASRLRLGLMQLVGRSLSEALSADLEQ